ncbi:MAG: polysaccharide deacetylase family protein [Candidatus Marinimicrobia bacterium]|nr:polysaccharide deacetylase family protein [Candidatus Neomarinimicrobiota bacterium]
MNLFKWLSRILLTILLVILILYGTWQFSKSRTHQLFGEFYPRVETADSLIALTFDDGPSQEYTDKVIEILEEENVKATFFVTGAELRKYPEGGKKLVDTGHILGNHSYSHKQMVLKSMEFIRNEIEVTDSLIQTAGYDGEVYFRPPYGKRLVGLPWYLKRHNRKTVMWDIEPESFSEIMNDSEKIRSHIRDNLRPGSIILLHVMYKFRQASRDALPGIIADARSMGYQFVTVPQLIDHSGE